MAQSHLLGLPRIGAKRELKFALEKYWREETSQEELQQVAHSIRQQNWSTALDKGIDWLTVGDFSFYDQVLDTSILLGVTPERFENGKADNLLDNYFRIARGSAPQGSQVQPSEMTKWFNTNYHYIVPEFNQEQQFSLNLDLLQPQIDQAKDLSSKVKVQLIGPVTYLWLGKSRDQTDFNKLGLLPQLVKTYQQLLNHLEQQGIEWVQIEEPILALDLDDSWVNAVTQAYTELGADAGVKLLLTTYFGHITDKLDRIAELPLDGLHLDLVSGGNEQLAEVAQNWPKSKVLSVGIVNGRNIWRNDLKSSLDALKQSKERYGDNLWVSSSCSLLHSPVDLNSEQQLDDELQSWLAFAEQKVQEVADLSKALNHGSEAIKESLQASDVAVASKKSSSRVHNSNVQQRVAAISELERQRKSEFAQRKNAQREHFRFPLLATTTIGSFPQTDSIRQARRAFKSKEIDEQQYTQAIQQEIQQAIHEQEAIGLDVLVHGEAERNDMVEYFGEQLNGFAFTQFGWVQSYGSRCVKPPIIYGDVSRKQAITVEWSKYAQSLSEKKVKGMLTGPTTILAWSFEREDLSAPQIADQIALALRDEVLDLEKNGIDVIQIDEPAFRELLPLRKSEQPQYLEWSVNAFRLSTAGVADTTQIHTHMCYSEFNEIIDSIARLDADVITIESSRSDMELLQTFNDFQYPNEIGPGVYDIHSPRIPTKDEVSELIQQAAKHIPVDQLWVNPDCGLKTRNWDQVRPALKNLVDAATEARQQLTA
ncbi:5-methyltetrahydropteroyltriglutamate--homocysteine S-methyltransferase [Kangiella geojedonensis]|uniref:5-methyltetrahydropteroyltriglutamate--homocysteine methyltransferase n=1 Tax=Kangiella geojedonensis TaxID=914150 RepID=A0A0F6TR83_9GAMM|nr:5-methyltetrahydropteroyltriglutamate--homocysteine S-methyltransferase [Kangiella geojedonensis]AKE52612.1 5-methyltetrahydropteroyltriglutamate--homocysteine methyltransferase [Kangiella geojedonensis]